MSGIKAREQHAVAVGYEIEHLQTSRRWHEATVIVVSQTVKGVVNGIEFMERLKEHHLIVKSLTLEDITNFLCRLLMTFEGQILAHEGVHTFTQRGYHIKCQFGPGEKTVIATRYGMFDTQRSAGQQFAHRLIQQHTERTDICTLCGRGGHWYKFHLLGRIEAITETLRFVIDTRHYGHEWKFGTYTGRKVKQRLSAGNFYVASGIEAVYR